MADAAAAFLAFQRETLSGSADAVERHPLGTVFLTPSLDAVWSLNALVVEAPPPGLRLDDLDAAFASLFAGSRFASAVLHDDDVAARVEGEARERGWKVEHEVVMELRRPADRVADTSVVRPGAKEEVAALMEQWMREEHAKHGEGTIRQLMEFFEREWRTRPPRAFVAGDAEAVCKLWSDGTIAQVEDVYTAPHARGRGHARALVTKAIAVARGEPHEHVFIVADDDDTPKELYARLGFDRVVRATRVVRERPT